MCASFKHVKMSIPLKLGMCEAHAANGNDSHRIFMLRPMSDNKPPFARDDLETP